MKNNPVIRLNLDTKGYADKATAKREITGIKTRLKPTDVNMTTLLCYISFGQSFCPGECTGTKAESWISQQLFCVDIDNANDDKSKVADQLTMKEALEVCEAHELKPAFAYWTFSKTDDWEKYRLAFLCDEVITDFKEAENIRKGLISLFRHADQACSNADRVFYGTTPKNIAMEWTGDTVTKEKLLEPYNQRAEEEEIEYLENLPDLSDPAPTPAPIQREEELDLQREYENFDLASYVEQTTGAVRHKVGSQLFMNPCPLPGCGHNDDFHVDGCKWYCHSRGQKGGNIINYLMEVNNWDIKTARNYFIKDILHRESNYNEWRAKKRAEQKTSTVPAGVVPEWIIIKVDKNTGEVKSESVCCPKLAQYVREHEHYLFVKNSAMGGENRFWYSNGYYKQVGDKEIKAIIKQYIKGYNLSLISSRCVNEVFFDLTTDMNTVDESETNNEENLVNMMDGVLDMDTWELMPHDPKYRITRQIPVKWADCLAQAGKHPVFDRYLSHLLEGHYDQLNTQFGKENARFLYEYMGACLSNVNGSRYKKCLIMWGTHDSGKSQIRNLTEFLLGAENCATVDIKDLEERFGTSKIYNKRMFGHGDMSFMRIEEAKQLKSITGGDSVDAEYKGKNGFQFQFKGLAWFCANQRPAFGGDQGKGVYDRYALINCKYPVPESERDGRLIDKMKQEAPAIVYDCLKAFNHTRANFSFDEPESFKSERDTYRIENDNVFKWIDECCWTAESYERDNQAPAPQDFSQNTTLSPAEHYRHYKQWCIENENGHALTKTRFYKAVEGIFEDEDEEKGRDKTHRYFNHFRLRDDEENHFRALEKRD